MASETLQIWSEPGGMIAWISAEHSILSSQQRSKQNQGECPFTVHTNETKYDSVWSGGRKKGAVTVLDF